MLADPLTLHVPPALAFVSVIDELSHTVLAPPIAAGLGFTVTTTETVQPVPNEYIIVDVPGVNPLTSPVAEPTVATLVALLVHAPPPGDDKVVVAPAHTLAVPVIGDGADITVTVIVVLHPLGNE